MDDPTEPTLAEDPASQAQGDELFRLAIERLPTATGVAIAATGQVLHYNAAFTRLFGYTVEDIPTVDDWTERAYPEPAYRAQVLERWAAMSTRTDQAPGLFEVTCKDGSPRITDISVTWVGQYAVATFVDVTERESARRALASAEARHRLALDAAELGTLSADLRTRLVDLDERAREHLGVVGPVIPIDELKLHCHPDDRAQLGATLAVLLDPKGPGRGPLEHRVILASGEVRWISVHVVATFANETDGPRAISLIATTRDVTAARRSAEALHAAEQNRLAGQRMESLGRLAGGVAHDFNNLLTVIHSYASLAVDERPMDDDLRDDLLQILNASERAEALTRQLLAFSSRQLLSPARVDLNQLVESVDSMLGRLIGEDITRALELEPNVGELLADRGQLEQVLMNLVVNARDAMPNGGHLTVSTRSLELDAQRASELGIAPGAFLELGVADTGCGMDAETRNRAFEPFFTTKATGKGTGLGLALVYGVVHQSGGAVVVESERGVGTTVHAYFPCATGASAGAVARKTSTPAFRGHGETLLVVDDEAALRTVLRRALSSAGYTVLLASDGEEALRICELEGERIRLVLTDVIMPRANGRVVADRLAVLRPDLPVIFMSGYTDDLLGPLQGLEGRVLRKPFSIPRLLATVGTALDAR